MKKLTFFMIFLLISGCCTYESIGLKASSLNRESQDYLEVWIPFGISHDYMAKDFLYFRREIPYGRNREENIRNALNELLKGTTDSEKQKGAYSLVKQSRVLDLKIKREKAVINFSQEFAPAGGSHAVWESRIVVEEVLRQFGIKRLEIFVDGKPAIESLQP